ncbi:MAG TPA: phosphoribosylformylglycinamidine synthase subunit PurS [Actinomycetota bacterium]|nr:phosphoribosylformylglycinamidine synthase subunit PurS [Actinomycetota bacterium]
MNVTLKPGIADPQGQTIERALPALGYEGVTEVRVGKLIELSVDASDEGDAKRRVEEMCERLLANPVIESYEVTIA